MAKLTYLLGAGASYHSIPIVDSMNERMLLFLNMWKNYLDYSEEGMYKLAVAKGIELPPIYKPFDKDSIEIYRKVIEVATNHRTVDTYARKLFLKNTPESLHDLEILKRFLTLYFAFEQSSVQAKLLLGSPLSHDRVKPYLNHQEHINTPLDYRYDVWMATLLGKDLSLPENISVVSWNYDHQVEMAFSDYAQISLEESRERLSIFPRQSKGESRMIKLNGSASQIIYDIHGELEIQSLEQSHFNSQYEYAIDAIRELGVHRSRPGDSYRGTALNFAWEEAHYQKSAMNRATAVLRQTTHLVVIGYSLPDFNRTIDLRLFKALKVSHLEELIIQCPESDYEVIRSKIIAINPTLKEKISLGKDLNQFYIPSKFLDSHVSN